MALKGVPKSPEHRAKLAAANRGKKHSLETRAQMSRSHMGRCNSDSHNAAISTARKGIVFSDETKAKMSAAKRGQPGRHLSSEEVSRFVTWRTGRPHDAATRAKMSAKRMGVPCPLKHRLQYRETWFRSTYEIRVAMVFDALGIAWQYEPERLNLGEETYLPDFYLPEFGMYVEVKGWFDQRAQQTATRYFQTFGDTPPLAILLLPQIKQLEALVA
jgi:NUMOD3 motif